MAMMGHEDECPPQWVDSITETAKLVMPLLPKPARLSAREFVKVCARINTNSHRQHHMFVPQRILGVGLYPLASLINHSCQPNCGFYNRGPKLYIRTLCGTDTHDTYNTHGTRHATHTTHRSRRSS